ncbi:trans-sulfuration enzyme family protein [Thioalkalivibrio sp. HK1]|uniref:trans-sulfuration enzyme family protein n=1 Tax=Thioalkalivibrio sp. HK1 TaxID=1469245 RepID=UPI000472D08C|nr:PLP-dependent aspartate aminotransferase family protein [Thioalkalivibrio sp. HK1]
MTPPDDPALDTLLARGGDYIDPETGAIVPPIHTSTTYARDRNYDPIGYLYARNSHPTAQQVEEVLASIEGARAALLFASGLAGVSAFFETLRAGDRVIAPRIMYYGAAKWLQRLAERRGIDLRFFDATESGALVGALESSADAGSKGQTAVWIEPLVNPTWDVIDIRAAARAAKSAGAILAVDATVTPPVGLRALDAGADFVFHSATKYLAGHSDVTAGVIAGRDDDERWQDLLLARTLMGGVIGPFEAWLLLRGMRTLHLRYARQCENAMAIAQHFKAHPRLERVLYPGLAEHPGHAIAKEQMKGGFGGMLSLLVRGDALAAQRVATRTSLFVPATSLGGVESLIEHRASVEGPQSLVPGNLLRLSVGIERAEDLIADLERALT